jgi:molybdopterin-containing oxidoreductase family molybdopterin binding subunit
LTNGIFHASWSSVPDFQYCEYAMLFGASKGHGAGHVACSNMADGADARIRGMRLVVVDPMCNFASAKADEWVPIIPGTDAALALGMVNVILNDLETWDAEFLASKTNAPYLIGPDGKYLRDPSSSQPLVWDLAQNRAACYDDPEVQEMALEGSFQVDGTEGRPSFVLLREHVRQFTPEWAAKITRLPASTISRLAEEFASHARIGSTIVIDGQTLPFRPAAAVYFRGAQGHKNSLYNCFSISLLNQIVGAADVPGGCLGFNPTSYGHPDTGKPFYHPTQGPDGLMVTGSWVSPHLPYPFSDPRKPETMSLSELFPMGMYGTTMASGDQEELWSQFDLPYRPEVMLNCGANSVMSVGNAETVAETLKRIPFIVSIEIALTEFADFADIILPDTTYLETVESRPNFPLIFNHPAGMGEWTWPIKQPVVEPPELCRPTGEVLVDLCDRIGIRPELNIAFNALMKLEGEQRLNLDEQYSYEEICDRELKNNFGEERGLDWFKKNGLIKWPKRVEEVYWRVFLDVRVPIYWEYLIGINEKAKPIAEAHHFPWDERYYEPLPSWLPCPSHETRDSFDLFGFYYRDTIHTNSFTYQNPWLAEASQMDPFSLTIALNRRTGLEKGLKEGQKISLETRKGRRVEGQVHLTETIHPECVGIGGCAGHWAKTLPVAHGKGVFFNELLEIDWDHTSPVNLNMDTCVKVRIIP